MTPYIAFIFSNDSPLDTLLYIINLLGILLSFLLLTGKPKIMTNPITLFLLWFLHSSFVNSFQYFDTNSDYLLLELGF